MEILMGEKRLNKDFRVIYGMNMVIFNNKNKLTKNSTFAPVL